VEQLARELDIRILELQNCMLRDCKIKLVGGRKPTIKHMHMYKEDARLWQNGICKRDNGQGRVGYAKNEKHKR